MSWLVVDAMNVIGSRPDGWWRDRQAAVASLVADVRAAAGRLDADRVTVVVDGRGDDEHDDVHGVEVVWAGPGPDAADARIVDLVRPHDGPVTVVTADRALRAQLASPQVAFEGPRTFRDRLART